MGVMDCRLCGLPAPTPPIFESGLVFCCHGCAAVYRGFGKKIISTRQKLSKTKLNYPKIEGSEAFLRIDGLHCSSCEILINKSAERIEGILSVSTSYATSTAKVIYDPKYINKSELPSALSLSGYKARFHSDKIEEINNEKSILRFVLSVGFAGMVMMLNLAFFYPMDLGLVTIEELKPVDWLAFNVVPKVMLLLTTILVFIVGFPILRGAWIGIRARVLNMDNLLVIAILGAYFFSIGQIIIGELNFFFDVSAVIVAVVTVGRYYEREAKANATMEISNIIGTWSPSAKVKRNGDIIKLELDEIKPGDHILIEENEPIPVNGKIISGHAAINESLMTGEPFPVIREIGHKALGGSIVVEGKIEIEVGKMVESQVEYLSNILWNVQSSSTGTLGIADKISRIFVPIVLSLSVIVCTIMLFVGSQPSEAILAGLVTLIVSCPCTFGIAVPLTSANSISTALSKGIIFSSADIFEKDDNFETVAIDKTGTLSTGEMSVEKIIGEQKTIAYAAAVERLSVHPIAKAIATLDLSLNASNYKNHPGKGAEAKVDGHNVIVGSRSLFLKLGWKTDDSINQLLKIETNSEKAVSFVGWDGSIFGAIITSDKSRPEWEMVVNRLRRNKSVVLLTGAENSSDYDVNLDYSYAGLPPEAKTAVIRQLQKNGKVVMIGDGNNDAPALAEADLGIAFGMPTSLAADAADVVIPGKKLDRIFTALDLIKITRKRIRQNIGWALLYNAIAIPLALTGELNPLFAAVAMGSSSFFVVWNSSRSFEKIEKTK